MTSQEFAQSVKQKYPQYQSLDDATLVQKMVQKYPQYKGQISDYNDSTIQSSTSVSGPSAAERDFGIVGKAANWIADKTGFGKTADIFGSAIAPSMVSQDAKKYIKAPTAEELAGATLKTGSLIFGGPVASAAAFGAGSAMEENAGIGGIATGAGIGAVTGKVAEVAAPIIGKAITSAGGFMKEAGAGSAALRSAAERQYAKVLAPTTKEMKQTTAKIVPEIANRGIKAFSLKGLLSKAEEGLSGASQQLEAAWSALPEEHQTSVKPILESIAGAMDKLTIKGADGKFIVPEGNAVRYGKLGQLRDELMSIVGDENAPTRLLREYRQTLDEMINKAGKGFGLGLKDSDILSARKTVANSIRNELAKANPDIAAINNEFTFWKRMHGVLSATIERKTGQAAPLGQKMAQAAGTAAGFAHGGPLGAVEGGIIMKNLVKLTESTGWNTLSASVKSRIADALASGEGNMISEALSVAAKATGTALEKTGSVIGGIPGAIAPTKEKIRGGVGKYMEGKGGLSIQDVSKGEKGYGGLLEEAKKYKTTVNIQDKNDLEYLKQILNEDSINDILSGKKNNWRGTSYEDLAGVNIISETPKTIEQQLSGRIKDVALKSDTFYHGTSSGSADSIMSSGFIPGSKLPKSAYRGGGYGKMQSTISFAETPKEAGIFSTLTKDGKIVEAKLKPNARVVSIDGIEDAVDLEDYIGFLRKQKVDAVYIGGGEKELVVINPKSVSPTKSQLTDIWNKANQVSTDQSLLSEARKYKSAEEFLNSFQDYHGAKKSFSKFDSSKIGSGEGSFTYGKGLYTASKGDADFYSSLVKGETMAVDKNGAKMFDLNKELDGASIKDAKNLLKKYGVSERDIQKYGSNAADGKDLWSSVVGSKIAEKDGGLVFGQTLADNIRKSGNYDGMVYPKMSGKGTFSVLWNTEKPNFYTKQQLTDIWNQAHKAKAPGKTK